MTILKYFADLLSIITIAMCLILKVPQILNVVNLKSAAGISILGLLLELSSYTVMALYNYTNDYSLLLYMEYPVILIQEFILIYFVLKYLNLMNIQSLLAATVYSVLFICFLLQIIPKVVLTFLAPLCTPVSVSSKVVQLFKILRTKDAETVSILTWLISAFTNLTRVFTIWMDSADVLLLGNFIISVTLSSSILISALYYKRQVKRE